jgi:hypothetical protein
MQPLLLPILIAALSVVAAAQTQVEPPARKEVRSTAVTLTELEGKTVYAVNGFTARFRSPKGEASGAFTLRRELRLLPNAAVAVTSTRVSWWDTPSGRKTGQRRSTGTATIGQPRERKVGTGTVLFVYEANTLTWLSVLKTGATTLKITFKRGPAGLTCSAVAAVAQEVGAGPTTVNPNDGGGGTAQVLWARPTSSTCTVQPSG